MIRLEIQAIFSGVLIYFLGSLCSILEYAYSKMKVSPYPSSYTAVSLASILASWIIISFYLKNREKYNKKNRSVSDFFFVSSIFFLMLFFSFDFFW